MVRVRDRLARFSLVEISDRRARQLTAIGAALLDKKIPRVSHREYRIWPDPTTPDESALADNGMASRSRGVLALDMRMAVLAVA